jgi:hypothetical protein
MIASQECFVVWSMFVEGRALRALAVAGITLHFCKKSLEYSPAL